MVAEEKRRTRRSTARRFITHVPLHHAASREATAIFCVPVVPQTRAKIRTTRGGNFARPAHRPRVVSTMGYKRVCSQKHELPAVKTTSNVIVPLPHRYTTFAENSKYAPPPQTNRRPTEPQQFKQGPSPSTETITQHALRMASYATYSSSTTVNKPPANMEYTRK